MRSFFLFLIIAYCGTTVSQNIKWAKGFGEAFGDYGAGISVDASGNVYTIGQYRNSMDFDPGPGQYIMGYNGNYDIFVQKLDSTGNFVWAYNVGSATADYPGNILVDKTGNVITSGTCYGCDFDPSSATYTLPAGIYIQKVSANKTLKWAVGWPFPYTAYIANDSKGNIYMTGFGYLGTLDYDPGPGSYTLNCSAYLLKLDSMGNFAWAKPIDGVPHNSACRLAVDASDNIYAIGQFTGTVDFDPSTAVYTLQANSSNSYGTTYIQKYASNGNFIYAKKIDNNIISYVTTDRQRNVFLSGTFTSTVDLDPGPLTHSFVPVGYSNSFILKLDSNGAYTWAGPLTGRRVDCYDLICDTIGNVFFSGTYLDSADIDMGPGINRLQTTANTYNGIFLKYNAAGNLTWYSDQNFSIGDVALDKKNNILLTGSYVGPFDFDNGPGTYTLNSAWNTPDVFVLKLGQNQCSQVALVIDSIRPIVCSPGAGSAYSHVVGGSGPYTYSWTGAGTAATPSIQSAAGGNYTLSISDQNNCSRQQKVTVLSPLPLSVSKTITSTGCNATGQIQLVTAGGSAPYTYSWSASSSTAASLTSLAAGIYTAYISDARSCLKTETLAVVADTFVPLSVSGNTMICSGNTATLSASGASTYSWSTLSVIASTTLSPASTTTLSVTGTGTNSCVKTISVTIQVNNNPVISINSGSFCAGQSFTLQPLGAATYTYSGGNNIVSPLSTSSYSVSGTDAFGCISATPAIATLTVYALPTLSVNSGAICPGQVFTITPSGAFSYTISGGQNTVSPLSTSAYSVTGASIQGCIAGNTAVASVVVYSTPVISVNSPTICSGNAFTLNPSGAVSYTISGGPSVIPPSGSITYSVSGTSSDGCVSAYPAQSTVTIHSLPSVTANSGVICQGQSFTLSPAGADVYVYQGFSQVVTPIINTSYLIAGTNTLTGCSGTTAVTVSVNPLPVIVISSTIFSVCAGGSISLNAAGADVFTWSNGISNNIPFSPSATATYSVAGTNTITGCSAAGPSVQVIVNNLPVISITGSSMICVGETVSLTAGGADSYTWSTGATASTIVESPTLIATYTVEGLNLYHCSNVASYSVSVSPCTGINNILTDNPVIIYPNPNHGLVTLELPFAATITVTGALGRHIFNAVLSSGKQQLDLENQVNGIYFIHVRMQNGKQVVKVMKE